MLDFITWNANPELLNFGFLAIRWYGLAFAIGFIIGYWVVSNIFRHEGAPEKWLGVLLTYVVVATIVGSRLGHVFFYAWDYYSQHPLEIFKIWEGGLASHGGTIAIVIAVFVFSKFVSHKSVLWTFDRLVVPVGAVAGLIRLGNLMNSEIYGGVTELPWGFIFVRNGELLPAHPTQIYEALCYFTLFALLMWMYWRRNAQERPGLIFGTFLIGIFLPRFLIEYLKNVQEPWEIDMIADYGINMGQLLSIPFVIAGVVLVVYALLHKRIYLSYPDKFSDEVEQKNKWSK